MVTTTIYTQFLYVQLSHAPQLGRAHHSKTVCCEGNAISYRLNLSVPRCRLLFVQHAPFTTSLHLLHKTRQSHAPQRIAYRWKALALRYTLILLAMHESLDIRYNDEFITTTTCTCAATTTVTLRVFSTTHAPVNGITHI